MDRERKKRLIDIGIAEKEAVVYLALLEKGPSTADQTAKAAHLNRSTTYVQLEKLKKVGLITTFKRGKKTFFAAESPENLERLIALKQQKLELDKANIKAFIPDLMNLFTTSGDAPSVRMYEGIEGVRTLRKKVLECKSKEVFIMANINKFEKLFSMEERAEFSEQRSKRKIKSHLLYTADDNIPDLQAVPPQKLKRIPQRTYALESDVYVFHDHIAFVSYGDYVHGMLIESPNMSNTMRAMFKMLWEFAPTYSE